MSHFLFCLKIPARGLTKILHSPKQMITKETQVQPHLTAGHSVYISHSMKLNVCIVFYDYVTNVFKNTAQTFLGHFLSTFIKNQKTKNVHYTNYLPLLIFLFHSCIRKSQRDNYKGDPEW